MVKRSTSKEPEVTVRLTPVQRRALERMAADTMRSVPNLARAILANHLRNRGYLTEDEQRAMMTMGCDNCGSYSCEQSTDGSGKMTATCRTCGHQNFLDPYPPRRSRRASSDAEGPSGGAAMSDWQCPYCGSVLSEGHRCYVIPTSCWRPREGTGIPADAQMYPPGCPDADWCRGNRACYWQCNARDEEFG